MKKLVALHKHWINADAIRQVVMTKNRGGNELSDELKQLAEMHSSYARLSVLYGLIFVVVDGYKELKYTNDKIDNLLTQDDFVDALRLFRNAIFHYQEEAISKKALKFLELEESETWIRELHIAFKLFFEKELPIQEMLEKINT